MFKTFALLAYFILFHATCFAQKPNDSQIEGRYVKYFELEPETIYTQTNKSKYFANETLWFKSYIYNTKTQLPYLSTTNVYAAIYDVDGRMIDKKLLYAIDGITNGEFKLSEYAPGTYFLKVFTNYMRNFSESYHSLQEIEILGDDFAQQENESLENEYDFQLLPEGGHLLNDVNNTIGFKILNANGEGAIIESGKVLDSKGQVITTFKSNELGMGKFSLMLKNNDTHFVEALLEDGTKINTEIPKAQPRGIAVKINNLNATNLFISIQTNKSTLPELLDKTYSLAIHRDGLMKKIDLNFQDGKYDYLINVPKQDLLSGINIITVFNDENKPLVERVIFNSSKTPIENVELVNTYPNSDSTKIRLRTKLKDTIQKNISISVLPSSTKAYTASENIISKFLLSPYIEGNIENADYYFSNNDRQTTYDLDLLLLTQGWSKYSWNKIFSSPPKELFHFESGMQVKGKVSDKDKNTEIIFLHKESNTMLNSGISEDGYFGFENLLLLDSTKIYFSLKNKKENLSKANVYVNIYPAYQKDSINTHGLKSKKPINILDNNAFYENFILENTTSLDTVMLEVSKKRQSKNQIIYGGFNTKKIELENIYDDVTLVTDIISANGFDVYNSPRGIEIAARRGVGYSFSGKPASPNIYIDNQLMGEAQMIILMNLMVKDVDEIFISRTPSPGTVGVAGGLGGNINIYTKKSFSGKYLEKQSSFSSKIVEFGYSLPEKYQSPFYNASQQESFSKYGVLNWIPNLSNDENGEFEFKIPNYRYEDILLFIEGMGSDGSLISKTITINID
ncbi:hypothetical protein C1T31_05990 [Hanstruepera neustonica]|uniref:TonB-dependent receptor plug domain-containing protein n=1 Tax=Hanstruepera neustonica TaxID=1445657 RepID=A0A2K1E0T3_9FLAO|nr:hypothetical protein [Hanstruepera neustonica]PNQ73875.1 hypothetical protein C1T31_05990 [Hanstruepera neustonica]